MASAIVPVKVDLWYDDQWNDHTSSFRGLTAPGGGIHIIRAGSPESSSRLRPTRASATLNNSGGVFSPRNPLSALYGKIGRNTPIRVRVDDAELAAADRVRLVGEVPRWPQEWTVGSNLWVPIEIAGITQRLTQGAAVWESPLRRHYLAFNAALVAYVPLEDGADTVRMGANVVDGASAIRYDITGSRAPGWAQDDTCPGSAPLPEWTPIEYFGWSFGASVLPHTGDEWEVHVTFRAPSGTASVVLCEWRTQGSVTDWELRIDSSGDLELFGTDGADTPTTVTVDGSSLGAVDDGVWRTCAVTGVDDPGFGMQIFIRIPGVVAAFGNPSGVTIGRVTAIRPRPMWQSAPPGGAEPVGLGHMAVSSRAHMPLGPADGHAGEGAPDRFLRLCREALVPARLVSVEATVSDEFDRTETGGWGDADTGQTWTAQEGSADDLSVAGSAGVVEMAAAPGHVVTATAGLADVLVRTVVSPGQVATGAEFFVYVAFRVVDEDNFYAARLAFGTSGFMLASIRKFVGGVAGLVSSTEVAVEFPYAAGSRFAVRVAMVGERIEMQVWDADTMGVGNLRTGTDGDLTAAGDVGIATLLDVGNTNTDPTVAVEEFHAEPWVEPTRLGPQQRTTFVDQLQQTADTDGGLLDEDRTARGYVYTTRAALYNQAAALTVAYTSGLIAQGPKVTEDERHIHNDVTVRMPAGSSARAVQDTGPLNVQDPADDPQGVGRYARTPVTLNLHTESQLPSHAAWRRHLGTVDQPRWTRVPFQLAKDTWQADDTSRAAAAALDTGRLLLVTGVAPGGQLVAGPDDVRALVRGYDEVLSGFAWDLGFVTSPGDPFTVLEWAAQGSTPDPDAPSRWDSDGSTVASDFDAGTDTSLSVAVADGSPLWTTDSGDLPLDIMAAGVRLRVTAISGTSSPQTFTVTQTPVNGAEKTIPAGSAVNLFTAAPWAL